MSRVSRFALGLALGVLGCVYTASAQNVVTGTIHDPNGNAYANGTASALLAVVSGQVQPSSTNVATNAAGFFTMTLATGSYSFTICAPPSQLPPVNPVANLTPRQICFISGAISISNNPQDISAALNAIATSLGPQGSQSGGSQTLSSLNNIIYVDGVTYPFTDVGIQKCINAAEAIGSGSTCFMPTGTYIVGPSLPITISSRVSLIGAGWSTFLQVNSNVSSSTDVILVQPTGNGVISGIRIQDFQILPQSGHPARHGIQLDGTNGLITEIIVDHVIVLSGLGSSAINAIGAGNGGNGPQGTPALSTFQNVSLVGGSTSPAGSMTFSNMGDTNRILNSRLSGPGAGIDISNYQVGSAKTLIHGNNITNDGGSIHIGSNAVAPDVTDNEFETNSTFTGSHGALVDYDGTDDIGAGGTVAVQGGTIKHNSFQIVNGITADGVRLNSANLVYVGEGNRFGHGATTSHDITLTANATNNIIGNNLWMGTGNVGGLAYTAMVNDAGTNTSFQAAGAFVGFPGVTLAPNGIIYGVQDTSATPYEMAQSESAGGTLFFGYHNNRLIEGANGATYLYDGVGTSDRTLAATSGAISGAVIAGTAITDSNHFTTANSRAKVVLADQGTACTNGELALSAGWQSTGSATVTAAAGNGQTCSWTITTGTTTAANPTITDTLTNALPAATTVCWMSVNGGTHTPVVGAGTSDAFRQTVLSSTAPVFTYQETPTAGGTTYFVTRGCGP